jgi:hypothetical protein
MLRICVVGLLVGALSAGPALAAPATDHMVRATDLRARLDASHLERAANLAVVNSFLDSEVVAAAASRLGTDQGRLQATATSLGDKELASLASRVKRLSIDPVAGAAQTDPSAAAAGVSSGPSVLLIILASVGAVLIVLILIGVAAS